MEWYRAYHGMPYDPKFQVIARRTGQPVAFVVAVWMCILDAASQHNPRGTIALDPEEVAVIQGMELEAARTILKAFHDKGMIDESNKLTAWDKRQHSTTAERVKKYRNSKKRNVTRGNAVKRDVTEVNDLKRQKTKKETDTEQSRTDSEAETDAENKTEKNSEKERERRKEEHEKEKPRTADSDGSQTEIAQQMLDIWDAEVQKKLTRGQKAALTETRKKLFRARWKDSFYQDIGAWRYYCEIISASDYCMGRIKGKDWTINLTWAIESRDNVAKVLEGSYSGGKHPAPAVAPVCHDPELKAGWDHVQACFTDKYSKESCASWLSGTEVTGVEPYSGGVRVVVACPSRFIREWLTEYYLADLNLWWSEHRHSKGKITGVQLKVKEA